MSVLRVHHYRVDPSYLTEFLAQRTQLIADIRAAHPGLTEVRLIRLEDGTYTDMWRWESLQRMAAAFPVASSPEADVVMSLVAGATAVNGEIVDER